MKVQLEYITSDDPRRTAELAPGEVVAQHIRLIVDDRSPRQFTVFVKASVVKANVLSGMDASLVYGDALLEEQLRFESAALSRLYSLVGRFRRGLPPAVPVLLADSTEQAA